MAMELFYGCLDNMMVYVIDFDIHACEEYWRRQARHWLVNLLKRCENWSILACHFLSEIGQWLGFSVLILDSTILMHCGMWNEHRNSWSRYLRAPSWCDVGRQRPCLRVWCEMRPPTQAHAMQFHQFFYMTVTIYCRKNALSAEAWIVGCVHPNLYVMLNHWQDAIYHIIISC